MEPILSYATKERQHNEELPTRMRLFSRCRRSYKSSWRDGDKAAIPRLTEKSVKENEKRIGIYSAASIVAAITQALFQ